MEINRERLAWAAGLFEGEGCICGSHSGKNRSIAATLGMTDEDVVRQFHAVMGFGDVYAQAPQREGWKPKWVWKAGSFEHVQATIAMLWPWLKSRRQAKALQVLRGYKNAEPSSIALTRERTAAIKVALQALEGKPLWGRRWQQGPTQESIAKEFGISSSMVGVIKQQMESSAL